MQRRNGVALFTLNSAPVSEERHYIERVIANGDIVHQTFQSYKGPIDDVRCRLLNAR